MAFHVPFEHRRHGQPIYIGFDVPPRPRRKRNWTGFFGFLFSLFSIFTAGILSPLALLVCLFGLRKSPRGFAATGTVISLVGSLILGTIITGGILSESHHRHRREIAEQRKIDAENSEKTRKVMASAILEMKDYLNEHSGFLPDPITGNMLTIKHIDAWENGIRFDLDKTEALIRSSGADKQFDTTDDLVSKIEGKAVMEKLLPME